MLGESMCVLLLLHCRTSANADIHNSNNIILSSCGFIRDLPLPLQSSPFAVGSLGFSVFTVAAQIEYPTGDVNCK